MPNKWPYYEFVKIYRFLKIKSDSNFKIRKLDNFIIQFKFQQIIYVINVWNKLILGHWRTDDLSSLEKQV